MSTITTTTTENINTIDNTGAELSDCGMNLIIKKIKYLYLNLPKKLILKNYKFEI